MKKLPTQLFNFASSANQKAAAARRTVPVAFDRALKLRITLYTVSADQVIVPEDTRRQYLLIQNNGTGNLVVGLDVLQGTAGLVLGPGQSYEPLGIAPTNQLVMVATGASLSVIVVEG